MTKLRFWDCSFGFGDAWTAGLSHAFTFEIQTGTVTKGALEDDFVGFETSHERAGTLAKAKKMR